MIFSYQWTISGWCSKADIHKPGGNFLSECFSKKGKTPGFYTSFSLANDRKTEFYLSRKISSVKDRLKIFVKNLIISNYCERFFCPMVLKLISKCPKEFWQEKLFDKCQFFCNFLEFQEQNFSWCCENCFLRVCRNNNQRKFVLEFFFLTLIEKNFPAGVLTSNFRVSIRKLGRNFFRRLLTLQNFFCKFQQKLFRWRSENWLVVRSDNLSDPDDAPENYYQGLFFGSCPLCLNKPLIRQFFVHLFNLEIFLDWCSRDKLVEMLWKKSADCLTSFQRTESSAWNLVLRIYDTYYYYFHRYKNKTWISGKSFFST